MKIISIILTFVVIFTFSLCLAADFTVKEAYTLYYQGEKDAAITMVKERVQEKPDPRAYYFLGYAYYEMKEMENAMKYFSKAYHLRSFYSPMSLKEKQ
jgi:tetratricopeptide (TPR) repeat protein